jgi:hypothetical protein
MHITKLISGKITLPVLKEVNQNSRLYPLCGKLEGLPPVRARVGEAAILLGDALKDACTA